MYFQNPLALITLLIFYLKHVIDGVGLDNVPKLFGLNCSFPLGHSFLLVGFKGSGL